MFFLHNAAQGVVNLFWRIAFISSAIQPDGSVAADSFHIIFCVCDEHFRIIRVRTVGRICQPEILPNHYSVFVARVIEFLIANHADPIAHHREVHVCVVSDCDVIFTCTVIQVGFAEAPVSATPDEAFPVDEKSQDMVVFIESHLADADLEIFRIRNFVINLEREICIVQVLCTVTFGPPEFGIVDVELLEVFRIENDSLFFPGSQFYGLLESDVSDFPFQ